MYTSSYIYKHFGDGLNVGALKTEYVISVLSSHKLSFLFCNPFFFVLYFSLRLGMDFPLVTFFHNMQFQKCKKFLLGSPNCWSKVASSIHLSTFIRLYISCRKDQDNQYLLTIRKLFSTTFVNVEMVSIITMNNGAVTYRIKHFWQGQPLTWVILER